MKASWYVNTGLPSTVPGMSARTRFGSVYIDITFLRTSSAVSDRWIVFPMLLLIFLPPSSPGNRAKLVSSGCGSTSTSP